MFGIITIMNRPYYTVRALLFFEISEMLANLVLATIISNFMKQLTLLVFWVLFFSNAFSQEFKITLMDNNANDKEIIKLNKISREEIYNYNFTKIGLLIHFYLRSFTMILQGINSQLYKIQISEKLIKEQMF